MINVLKLFKLIETVATMDDGRIIRSAYSYPQGVDIRVYEEKDIALVKAFGPHCRIIGTYL